MLMVFLPMMARPSPPMSKRVNRLQKLINKTGSTIRLPFQAGYPVLLALLNRTPKGCYGFSTSSIGVEAIKSSPRREELGLSGIERCPR